MGPKWGIIMRGWALGLALALAPIGVAVPGCESGLAFARSCCKVCKAGKACGDSCISRDKNCQKGVGCACDG